MGKFVLSLLVALVLGHQANAQGKRDAPILGLGAMSCSEFTSSAKDSDIPLVSAALQWALGYMSAMDHIGAVAGEPILFEGINIDTLGKTLAAFCIERPGDTLVKAANHIIN